MLPLQLGIKPATFRHEFDALPLSSPSTTRKVNAPDLRLQGDERLVPAILPESLFLDKSCGLCTLSCDFAPHNVKMSLVPNNTNTSHYVYFSLFACNIQMRGKAVPVGATPGKHLAINDNNNTWHFYSTRSITWLSSKRFTQKSMYIFTWYKTSVIILSPYLALPRSTHTLPNIHTCTCMHSHTHARMHAHTHTHKHSKGKLQKMCYTGQVWDPKRAINAGIFFSFILNLYTKKLVTYTEAGFLF